MMNEAAQKLALAMMRYDQGDPMRIQHFMKVYLFASMIGREENLGEQEQLTLEAAALVHDIGIHRAEELYGSSAGKYQELLGPAEAESMLRDLSYPEKIIRRVCFLVGHHHTYDKIDGPDYQILVEADCLVNLYEDRIPDSGQKEMYERIFRTEAGKRLFLLQYPIDPADQGENQ